MANALIAIVDLGFKARELVDLRDRVNALEAMLKVREEADAFQAALVADGEHV